jgi:hypothetical protein
MRNFKSIDGKRVTGKSNQVENPNSGDRAEIDIVKDVKSYSDEGNDVVDEGYWEPMEPGAELLFLANHELRLDLEDLLGEVESAAKHKVWEVAQTVRDALSCFSLLVTRLESEIYAHKPDYSRVDMTKFAQQFGQLQEGLWSMHEVLINMHDGLNEAYDKRNGPQAESTSK